LLPIGGLRVEGGKSTSVAAKREKLALRPDFSAASRRPTSKRLGYGGRHDGSEVREDGAGVILKALSKSITENAKSEDCLTAG
jgi:hypothetical protein